MTKGSAIVFACSTLLWGAVAFATPPSPQEVCDFSRITAWRIYTSCVENLVAKDAKGIDFDEFKAFWKCRHAYYNKWAKFQTKAALAGSTCQPGGGARFVDNGNGSVTDNLTGLTWEKKQNKDNTANLADPRDADNTYTWSAGAPYSEDGTAFSDFLSGAAGLNTTGFAGANGWRLPTIAELQTIMPDFPCTGAGGTFTTCSCPSPCVDASLDSANSVGAFYWSATTFVPYPTPSEAWGAGFFNGAVDSGYIFNLANKTSAYYVRAVRGGL